MKLATVALFVLLSLNSIAQYKEPLELITVSQIIGSTNKPIIIDSKNNYYQLNTGSKNTLFDWVVKSNNKLGGQVYAGYEAFHNTSGNTVIQILKQNQVDKIIVTDIEHGKKRVVKLSEKIDFPYGFTITENGLAFFTINQIVNLATGKVTNLQHIKKRMVSVDNSLTNGVFFEGGWDERSLSVINIATGKLVQKISGVYTGATCIGDWIFLQKSNAATGVKELEAFNVNTLKKIEFPVKANSNDYSYSRVGKNMCFLKFTSYNAPPQRILWDFSKNMAYDLKNLPESYFAKEDGAFSVGANNTLYIFTSQHSPSLKKISHIDFVTGKILQEWIWNGNYDSKYIPCYIKQTKLLDLCRDDMYGSFFGSFSTYTDAEKSVTYTTTIASNNESSNRSKLYQTNHQSNDDVRILVEYGKINRDNYKDVLIKNNKTEELSILLNDGKNNFTKAAQFKPNYSKNFSSTIFLKDVNKDNIDDIILIEYSSDAEPNEIGIFTTDDITKGFKYSLVKRHLQLAFLDYFDISLKHNYNSDFDKDGIVDKMVTTRKSVIIPSLPKASSDVQKKLGSQEAEVKTSLCLTFFSEVNYVFIDDFDKDGNTDFLVTEAHDTYGQAHGRYYHSYIFFNTNNGKEFECKKMASGLINIDTMYIDNQLTYIGRSSTAVTSFTCKKNRLVKEDTVVANIVRSNYQYNMFTSLNNDKLAELVNISYNPDVPATSSNSICVTVYEPFVDKGKMGYTGLFIDEKKEELKKEEARRKEQEEKEKAAKAKAQAEYDRLNPKKPTTTTTSTGAKKETKPATETQPAIDYSTLSKGLGVFKGVSDYGLVIELEATVWYKRVKPKGMLGYAYNQVYKAECHRFRYPGNSKTWYLISGSDCVYSCTIKGVNYSSCVSIKGEQFALAEPTIY